MQKEYLIHFIPQVSMELLNGEGDKGKSEEYICTASARLNEELSTLYNEADKIKKIYLTHEERKSLEKLHMIKERELLSYYRSIKYLRKFLQYEKKIFIKQALECYNEAQKIFKSLIKELSGFIAVNLYCRGVIKRFF